MNAILYASIIAVAVLSIFNLHIPVFATELNLSDSMSNDFAKNLKSKIDTLVASALNDTSNSLNSSLLTNESNLTSSNVIVSKNTVQSIMRSNSSSDDGNSIIKDKVTTNNGVCNSEKVGGNGNDTLYSSGKCNDMLTGGLGADKFTCGEGNDTIKDYNPKEGDVVVDRQYCEKIL